MVDSFFGKDHPLFEHLTLPAYNRVKHIHVQEICKFLKHLENELVLWEKTYQSKCSKPLDMISPVERILYRMNMVWGIIEHLKTVRETADFRSAFEKVQPKVVEFKMRVKQSKPIYDGLISIKDSSGWDRLSEAHKQIVKSWIEFAELGGVNLNAEKRVELIKIEKSLKQLSQKFEDNVRDASNKFGKLIKDKKEIEGLSPTVLERAAQIAKSKGHINYSDDDGPWMITLDDSIYGDVIISKNRNLSNELICASSSLASSGDHNNIPIIGQILKLRLKKAELLGYKNYAELSMVDKMATLEEADQLMYELRDAYHEVAIEDLKKLKEYCTKSGSKEEAAKLNDLDIAFWQSEFCGRPYRSTPCGEPPKSVEEVAFEYFSWKNVRQGLFNLSKTLFGIDIKLAKAPVWHPQVEFYNVYDSSCKHIANFYVDPYARRPQKEDGAWTVRVFDRSFISRDECLDRLPTVHLVYNLTPPTKNTPSLLTFEQVVTVFHEFGHALQHMLTKQDEGLVSVVQGIEWDAVELPSKFMEKWCYHKDTLMSIGEHYKTKESIPKSLCMDLLENMDLFRGLVGLQEVRMGILDLQLHAMYDPYGPKTALDVFKSVYEITSVYPMLQEDRYLCSISHIFTDEYAAGYYGYKWSEMMAVDVFSAFEVVGLNDMEAMKEIGHKFRETILALGGGNAAKELFKKFKEKEHSSKELLKQIRKSLPEKPLKPSSSKSSREQKQRNSESSREQKRRKKT